MWRRASVVADSVLLFVAISMGLDALLARFPSSVEWEPAGPVVASAIAIVLAIVAARFLDRGQATGKMSRAQIIGIAAVAVVAAAASVPWTLQRFGQDYVWIAVWGVGAAVAGALVGASAIDVATARAGVALGVVRVVSVAIIVVLLATGNTNVPDYLVGLMILAWFGLGVGAVALVWDLVASWRGRSKRTHGMPVSGGAA